MLLSKLTITWRFPQIGTGTPTDPFRNDPYTVSFLVEYKTIDGNWISLGRTFATEVEVLDVVDGAYYARVACIDFLGRQSSWVETGTFLANSFNLSTLFNTGNHLIFLGAL